jgi:hypothetical protein
MRRAGHDGHVPSAGSSFPCGSVDVNGEVFFLTHDYEIMITFSSFRTTKCAARGGKSWAPADH